MEWTCYHEPNPKSRHHRDHDQPEGAAASETGTRGDAFLDSSVPRWGESTFSSYGSMTATARNGEREHCYRMSHSTTGYPRRQ